MYGNRAGRRHVQRHKLEWVMYIVKACWHHRRSNLTLSNVVMVLCAVKCSVLHRYWPVRATGKVFYAAIHDQRVRGGGKQMFRLDPEYQPARGLREAGILASGPAALPLQTARLLQGDNELREQIFE